MKTYSAKPTDVIRQWYVIDASQANLGRLATQIAEILMGKNKPQFTHHIDCGDYVVVTNSNQLQVTGNKMETKIYYRHSGYPGGIKQTNLKSKINSDSTDVIFKAVRGMLPVNKLRDGRLARLKIYKDSDHNHSAQNPQQIKVKEAN